MPTYGVTATGFVVKTLDVIKSEMEDEWRSTFGNSVNLQPNSVNQQLISLHAEREAAIWELAEAVYHAFDPAGATGNGLDNLCAITGTSRDQATRSTVLVKLAGSSAATIPAGSQVSASATGVRFRTTAGVTLGAGGFTAWTTGASYSVGAFVTSSGNAYVALGSGVAGATAPAGTAADVSDGTVHWRYLGATGGYYQLTGVEAVETGPRQAFSMDLDTIENPVSGWLGVCNVSDADPGRDEETNAHLRLKREDEIRATGNAATDAIRAKLLRVADVTAVSVFENDTASTDVDGLPPHSIECLVTGGDTQEVLNAILASKGAGVGTYGNETGNGASDSKGFYHAIDFSRPVELPIWVIVALVKDVTTYPADGDAQVQAAIVAYGDAQATGKNAVASSVGAQAFTVPGVLDVNDVKIGLSDPPTTSTTIQVALRQVATFDTSRIVVNSINGTP